MEVKRIIMGNLVISCPLSNRLVSDPVQRFWSPRFGTIGPHSDLGKFDTMWNTICGMRTCLHTDATESKLTQACRGHNSDQLSGISGISSLLRPTHIVNLRSLNFLSTIHQATAVREYA
jgi:hypothetical protein